MPRHTGFLTCAGWLRAAIQGLFVNLTETFLGIPGDHYWENSMLVQQDRQIAAVLKSFTIGRPSGDVWEQIEEKAVQIRHRNNCENRLY
jgi:hypothetical protein